MHCWVSISSTSLGSTSWWASSSPALLRTSCYREFDLAQCSKLSCYKTSIDPPSVLLHSSWSAWSTWFWVWPHWWHWQTPHTFCEMSHTWFLSTACPHSTPSWPTQSDASSPSANPSPNASWLTSREVMKVNCHQWSQHTPWTWPRTSDSTLHSPECSGNEQCYWESGIWSNCSCQVHLHLNSPHIKAATPLQPSLRLSWCSVTHNHWLSSHSATSTRKLKLSLPHTFSSSSASLLDI